MAPKNRQPKAVREIIDADGDLVLQLRRPKQKSEAPDTSKKVSNGANGANGTNTTHAANGTNGSNGSVANGNTTWDGPTSPSAVSNGSKPTNGRDANTTVSDEPAMEAFELLVSSKMLCLVSPVFRTLLKSSFREATEFAASKSKKSNATSENEPYALDLPEDDVMAMDLLTRVIHFRLGDVYATEGDGVHSGLPDPELLERLAFVCDKYQCTNALQGVSDGWLRENMNRLDLENENTTKTQSGINNYCRLLVFAYVADQPRVFSDLCWNLFLSIKGPIAANSHENGPQLSPVETIADHPLLPRDLAAVLDARRLESCNRFHSALMRPVMAHSGPPEGSPDCLIDTKVLGLYWRAVVAAGLLSNDLAYSQFSVQDLCDGLDKLEPIPSGEHLCNALCDCNDIPEFDPAAELIKSKSIIQGERDGFGCLDCFRTDHESHKNQKCRVRHN